MERVRRIRSPIQRSMKNQGCRRPSDPVPATPDTLPAAGANGRTVIAVARGAIRKIRIRPAGGPAASKIGFTRRPLFRFDGTAVTVERQPIQPLEPEHQTNRFRNMSVQ
jgi:hypothetical protein